MFVFRVVRPAVVNQSRKPLFQPQVAVWIMFTDTRDSNSPVNQTPIRVENRSMQLTTTIVSLALVLTWGLQIGISLALLVTLLTFIILLSGLAMSRYQVHVYQDSDVDLRFVRPGLSWGLAAQSILGGSLVFATIFFFINSSVTPAAPLRFTIGALAIVFTFLMCPLFPLLSTIHPVWLKTIYRAQLHPPYSLDIERACVLDRSALAALSDHSLLAPVEEYLRSLSEPTESP